MSSFSAIQPYIKQALEKNSLKETARKGGFSIERSFTPNEREELVDLLVKSILEKAKSGGISNPSIYTDEIRATIEKENICKLTKVRSYNDLTLSDFPVYKMIGDYLKSWLT